MKAFLTRIINMLSGLFLFALGIVMTINANIGYPPWDVLHMGIAQQLGLTIGTAIIGVGLLIAVAVTLCGEKLGLGSIANMILIGVFIDWILASEFIPIPPNPAFSAVMLMAGLFVISAGSYFYIKSAFGAGPRDSFMVLLARTTKLPIGAAGRRGGRRDRHFGRRRRVLRADYLCPVQVRRHGGEA
jgi:uncharacterized membrane protein YczE